MSTIKNKWIGSGQIVVDNLSSATTNYAPSQNAVINALALKVSTTAVGTANGVASLGSDGKIPNAQLPLLAITDTFVVASQTAMLALTAQTGDVAIRTDVSQSYILQGSDPTVLANWQVLLSPTSPVSSVNGKTGAVVLSTTDIAEGTNLYYTDSRAQAGAVVNSLAGSQTTQAPSVAAVNSALAAKQATFAWGKEIITLNSTNVSNQYVDLAQLTKANSLLMWVDGVMQDEGIDFTLSTVSSKTRLTFQAGSDIATGGQAALVANDKVRVQYTY